MPWVPTSAGQTLTAAKMEDLASYGVVITATKTSDTNTPSDATVNNDSELVLVLPANRTYDIEVVLHASSAANAAGDLRVTYAWTNTATLTRGVAGLVNSLASGFSGDFTAFALAADTTSPAAELIFGVSTTRTMIREFLTVVTGGSSVTLTLQWAQETSNANNTTLHAGSKMIARRSA